MKNSSTETFLKVAADDPLAAAFTLICMYGLRRGEVLGLRWCDIDSEQGVIYIRQQLQRMQGKLLAGPVKTNAGQRDLPLLPAAQAVLAPLRAKAQSDDGLVFITSTGNPVEPGNLLRSFYRICQQHGLPRITLHHLRHTTATLLKNTGLPARDAQLILGHAHVSTTQQLYQHADLNGQRRALTALQTAMAGADSSRCGQKWSSNQIYERYFRTQKVTNNWGNFLGGPPGTRTRDILLKRQTL